MLDLTRQRQWRSWRTLSRLYPALTRGSLRRSEEVPTPIAVRRGPRRESLSVFQRSYLGRAENEVEQWSYSIKQKAAPFRTFIFPTILMRGPTARSMNVPGHPARPAQSAQVVKCARAILRNELGKRCLATNIARRLGMVRRSLQRHLSSEGTTFREISQQVQLQAAQRLLKKGASVSEVAKALGFSEVSPFTHAFRRWSGETPSSWKLRHERPRAEQPAQGASTTLAPTGQPEQQPDAGPERKGRSPPSEPGRRSRQSPS
jgi:AraC-like DNA-binding protein